MPKSRTISWSFFFIRLTSFVDADTQSSPPSLNGMLCKQIFLWSCAKCDTQLNGFLYRSHPIDSGYWPIGRSVLTTLNNTGRFEMGYRNTAGCLLVCKITSRPGLSGQITPIMLISANIFSKFKSTFSLQFGGLDFNYEAIYWTLCKWIHRQFSKCAISLEFMLICQPHRQNWWLASKFMNGFSRASRQSVSRTTPNGAIFPSRIAYTTVGFWSTINIF